MKLLGDFLVWTGLLFGASLMFVTDVTPRESPAEAPQSFSALPPVTYMPHVPPDVVERFQGLYRGTECSEVTVAVKMGMALGDGLYGSVRSAGPGTPCLLTIDWDTAIDSGWRAQYTLLHEMAHLETLSEPTEHGPVFVEHLFDFTHQNDTGRI